MERWERKKNERRDADTEDGQIAEKIAYIFQNINKWGQQKSSGKKREKRRGERERERDVSLGRVPSSGEGAAPVQPARLIGGEACSARSLSLSYPSPCLPPPVPSSCAVLEEERSCEGIRHTSDSSETRLAKQHSSEATHHSLIRLIGRPIAESHTSTQSDKTCIRSTGTTHRTIFSPTSILTEDTNEHSLGERRSVHLFFYPPRFFARNGE